MLKNLPSAQTVELMLTRACNMNCTYCFEKNKKGKALDFNKVCEILFKHGCLMPMNSFYLFGGEPMLNLPLVVQIIEKIKSDSELSSAQKDQYIRKIVQNFTTNGTLINKNLDILKKYQFSLQVSLDGPEDINDLHRKDYNGNGHFKEIMANVKLLQENNLSYVFHGAVNGENFKNFDKINEWFLEQEIIRFKDNPEALESSLYHNYCQIVFEDSYTDEQINELLLAYERTMEIIFSTPLLNKYSFELRKQIAAGFLARTGGPCSAGNSMFAIDDDFFIYSCHRLMTYKDDSTHELAFDGLYEDRKSGTNYKFYEQLLDLPEKKRMFGLAYDNNLTDEKNFGFQANWCPATNIEITGNAYVLPAHYTLLLRELQNFIPQLADYYNLDLKEYRNTHDRKNRSISSQTPKNK